MNSRQARRRERIKASVSKALVVQSRANSMERSKVQYPLSTYDLAVRCFSLVPWTIIRSVQETGVIPLEAREYIAQLFTHCPGLVASGMRTSLRLAGALPAPGVPDIMQLLDRHESVLERGGTFLETLVGFTPQRLIQ